MSICLSVEGVPWGAGNETRYVGRTCQEVSVYQILTISCGWLLRKVHLIVLSCVHATVSIRISVEGVPGGGGE